MSNKYTKKSNDSFFKDILKKRFKSIKGYETLIQDYENFDITITDCDSELKEKIIIKYESLSCKSNDFKERFGDCTFKEAFIQNYYSGIKTPRCCFCGQILEKDKKSNGNEYIIADLEHIFPKSLFPQLALHPRNLVPCCKECNQTIKGNSFFEDNYLTKFQIAIKDLGLDYENLHPLYLWKNIRISDEDLNFKILASDIAKEFINFYHLENRIKVLYRSCYSSLLNKIQNSDIKSIESLEKLLENLASTNWVEMNQGNSFNNSPHIWQEFIENILYDECKLIALWDEVKECNKYL